MSNKSKGSKRGNYHWLRKLRKASWKGDHDRAQNKFFSLDWPRGRRNIKLFITNLKIIWFLIGFIYTVDIIAATHEMS